MGTCVAVPAGMTSYPDPARSAEAAGLRYVSDSSPGIARKRAAGAFRYTGPDSKPILDRETLTGIIQMLMSIHEKVDRLVAGLLEDDGEEGLDT